MNLYIDKNYTGYSPKLLRVVMAYYNLDAKSVSVALGVSQQMVYRWCSERI